METLFDPHTYHDLMRRVDALQPDAVRQWGQMSAAQMLEHVARALEVPVGKRASTQAVMGRLIGWIFRQRFLGPTPLSRNGPTAPGFVVQDEPDFVATKHRVRALLSEFHIAADRGCDGRVHGFFGPMSGAEWGVMQYKHVDHHLRQFGA